MFINIFLWSTMLHMIMSNVAANNLYVECQCFKFLGCDLAKFQNPSSLFFYLSYCPDQVSTGQHVNMLSSCCGCCVRHFGSPSSLWNCSDLECTETRKRESCFAMVVLF